MRPTPVTGAGTRAQSPLVPREASFLQSSLVWAFVTLTFFPYLGIAIGENSSIPLTSVVALALLAPWLRDPRLLLFGAFIVVFPVLAGFFGLLVGGQAPDGRALIVWAVNALAFLGFAGATWAAPSALTSATRVGLLLSSAYAVIQKFFFLDRGQLLFVEYYNLPGYASLESRLSTVLLYVPRPFAFFPEPSTMASSIGLAALVYICLVIRRDGRLSRGDYFLVSLTAFAMFLSSSAAAVFMIGALLVMANWQRIQTVSGTLITLILGGIGAIGALAILSIRMSVDNYSWTDRWSSIVAAFQFQFQEISSVLFGFGAGNVTLMYARGDIPMDGIEYRNYPPDIYSVIGRVIVENGLVIGGAVVIALGVATMRPARAAFGSSSLVPALLLLLSWIVAAGLSTTYAAAAWMWAPAGIGIALGTLGTRRSPEEMSNPRAARPGVR